MDGPGRRRPKEDEIIGWMAKVEDRQEWNRIFEQTKTIPRVVQLIEEEENSKRYSRRSSAIVAVSVPAK